MRDVRSDCLLPLRKHSEVMSFSVCRTFLSFFHNNPYLLVTAGVQKKAA